MQTSHATKTQLKPINSERGFMLKEHLVKRSETELQTTKTYEIIKEVRPAQLVTE